MKDYKTYLDNILKNVPGAIYWKDANGFYLGCNQLEAQIAGLNSPEEIVGKTDYDLPWHNVADVLKITDQRVMETEASEELIESASLADGTQLIMLTNKSPLYNDDGKVIGIIGTALDITAYLRVQEREKEALAAAVEAEAKRKTEEEAKRAIMVLAGSIAHDLRTPLLTLALINQQLKTLPTKIHKADNTHQKMEEALLKISDKIANLTQDMHTFINHNLKAIKHSTLDTLQAETLVTCQSYKVLHSALEAYPFKPGEKELVKTDVTYYFDFLGNPILFLRITFNLLNNALYQIHDKGTGEIFITTEQEPIFNIIRFKDTAGGTSPDIMTHIFDGYKTTKKEGTGVGLAFCKLTMESFGGTMECHGVEGDYIEFILKFPKTTA